MIQESGSTAAAIARPQSFAKLRVWPDSQVWSKVRRKRWIRLTYSAGPYVVDPWFLAQSANSVQFLQRYLHAVNSGAVDATSRLNPVRRH
jgi:hypothetical protein